MIKIGYVTENKRIIENLYHCYAYNSLIQIYQLEDIQLDEIKSKEIDILLFECRNDHDKRIDRFQRIKEKIRIRGICVYSVMSEWLIKMLYDLQIEYYCDMDADGLQLYLLILRILRENKNINFSLYDRSILLCDKYVIPKHLSGRKYIIQALMILHEQNHSSMKDLYDQIARLEKTTSSRVERNIRMVISKSHLILRSMTNRECLQYLLNELTQEE